MDLFVKDQKIGEHIRMARLINGLTQQDLADRLGYTRQYIHQIESGVRLPSLQVEELFTKELHIKKNYKFNGEAPVVRVNTESLNFCRRKGATLTEIERAKLVSSVFLDFFEGIERYVSFPPSKFTSIFSGFEGDVLDFSKMDIIAEKIRMDLGVGVDAPISNMVRVAEKLGAIVIRIPEFSEKISAFSVAGVRPLIALNDTGNTFRSRFKISHEIGHLLLHAGLETGCADTEKQADYFASALLLPRHAFKKEFLDCYREGSKYPFNWSGLYELKKRWKVSVQAIIHRAFNLRLISAADFDKAYKYLAKNGQIKVEEGDSLLAEESPEVLKAALELLYKRKRISFLHLTDSLPFDPVFLQQLFGLDEQLASGHFEKDNIVLFGKRA